MTQVYEFAGTVSVITGGSRGLGLLIAHELGRAGSRPVLVARDKSELGRARRDLEARGIAADSIAADVWNESAATHLVETVVARHGRLDVLVNHTGVIPPGPLEDMTVADYREAMRVHFWGPLHTMRAAMPLMRRAGGGRIVNISAIGGKIGTPHLVPYRSSKFAPVGPVNVLVTTVCPELMHDDSEWFAMADSLPLTSIEGARAARQIVDSARHGDAELIITWELEAVLSPSDMTASGQR